jgi:hypothetical protein
MVDADALPAALGFLRRVLGDRETEYREASWRNCAFEAEIWPNRLVSDIDFRVELDDGTLLTDERHGQLLEIFKAWLCVQSHFDATGGTILDDSTLQHRIRYTLRLIDYFLLNAKVFQLAKYGLENISENDIHGLVLQISQSSSASNSIYRWPERLQEFLRNKSATLNERALDRIITRRPTIAENIPAVSARMLSLSNLEIVRARAWLWDAGYFEGGHGAAIDFRFTPNSQRLAEEIFRNTLFGRYNKPLPPELCLEPAIRCWREHPSVPVKTWDDAQMTDRTLAAYIAALRRLGLLEQTALPVPVAALRATDAANVLQSLPLKRVDRYRSLPQELVFGILRSSIEFALKYGASLVVSFLRLATESKRVGCDCATFCREHDIRPFLTSPIVKLGVKNWTVRDVQCNAEPESEELTFVRYFKLIRAGVGLWELLRVLYGSVQICVGALMARRQGELTELIAGKCLDMSATRLVFFNEKSGVGGMRQKEARPIPRIAAELIALLEQLQAGLISIGDLGQHTFLFAYPTFAGRGLIGAVSSNQYNQSIDYSCDYFETPINNKGQRHYVRQHQLRRFFAMLFFWGRSFGGMDTLRWFLGHTDVKHLYHYITESTPGDVLRSIKASYAIEQINAHAVDTAALETLLEQHFGTRRFSVLDSDELTEYVEELIDDGRVTIEPEFLESAEGVEYRVLIVVTPMELIR